MTQQELFNLGLKNYKEGHYSDAVAYLQRAAEEGEDQSLGDLARRTAVSIHQMCAWAQFQIGMDRNGCIEEIQDALKLSNAIIKPTDEDQAKKRECYRYLGLFYFSMKDKDQALKYYGLGEPINETQNTTVFFIYTSLMGDYYERTDDIRYKKKQYDASLYACENLLEKVSDPDQRGIYLMNVIFCKLNEGGVCPMDLDGAERLNEKLLELGPDDIQETYQSFRDEISSLRQEHRAKSGKKGFFNWLFG